ncbi:hypothetical protein O6H91_Y475500 [Diphasiastrum complanatum]|nr:hypothetical protein O6H91_Y475500 [Diphasiastrum complanatum]
MRMSYQLSSIWKLALTRDCKGHFSLGHGFLIYFLMSFSEMYICKVRIALKNSIPGAPSYLLIFSSLPSAEPDYKPKLHLVVEVTNKKSPNECSCCWKRKANL